MSFLSKYLWLNFIIFIGLLEYTDIIPYWYIFIFFMWANIFYLPKIRAKADIFKVIFFWVTCLLVFIFAYLTDFKFGLFYNLLFLPSLFSPNPRFDLFVKKLIKIN